MALRLAGSEGGASGSPGPGQGTGSFVSGILVTRVSPVRVEIGIFWCSPFFVLEECFLPPSPSPNINDAVLVLRFWVVSNIVLHEGVSKRNEGWREEIALRSGLLY